MEKIAIIHFGPIELYPPLQNFLNFLKEEEIESEVVVFTTAFTYGSLKRIESGVPTIRIKRIGRSGKSLHPVIRYWNYVFFYFVTTLLLFILRPARILYFETISSFPALIYKRFRQKKVSLNIHYHEYTTPQEYKEGMVLTRWFHRMEQKFFKSANWVSHTNEYRLRLFLNDIKPAVVQNPRTLPNFPSKRWQGKGQKERSFPFKIVYAGALSLDTMYTEAFARWIAAHEEKLVWHIYAYNISYEAKEFFLSLKAKNIRLHEGVDYAKLPVIFENYHAGVILYNGHIPNYIYNAPNKLFEYLACGLDVWYPKEMVGIEDYKTTDVYPKVVDLDFNELHAINTDLLISRARLRYMPSIFTYEKVYKDFYEQITES